MSQQEGCFPSVRQAWWEGGHILRLGGGPGEGQQLFVTSLGLSGAHPTQFGWGAGLVARDVCPYTDASSVGMCPRRRARGFWSVQTARMMFPLCR